MILPVTTSTVTLTHRLDTCQPPSGSVSHHNKSYLAELLHGVIEVTDGVSGLQLTAANIAGSESSLSGSGHVWREEIEGRTRLGWTVF